uniref:DUF6883 domain-containing protein n=1 Tax=Candidatus Kentrum sp. FM TaxID=2126340 RepID=A0A450W2A2_9GAMM|nr:MAG: hypothetical protein BECKFM1743C_GA0114222_101674 [Candidatus Kentron sp. FM]VFJ59247.1 MAG: hypothetical protein BECKFM1743A_GA0114220_102333 [Candidatus Kentron sp. FM]VFK11217.1 MAG: hypothetical protein BECKFM1743B_GA0114221_101723 [Candidatus Kentron sp. FM]
MKLPNAEKAFIDIRKLRDYCLNTIHERGKHKARLFSSVLGLTSDDAEEIAAEFLKAALTREANPRGEDDYGKRYALDVEIITKKGQAEVRTIWIMRNHEDFARLTSCYILKRKEPGK